MRHDLATTDAPAVLSASTFDDLASQLDALLTGETDVVANLANTAALIYHTLPRLNWAGFYLMRGGMLVLGPFQGKPACVRIELAKVSAAPPWRAGPRFWCRTCTPSQGILRATRPPRPS